MTNSEPENIACTSQHCVCTDEPEDTTPVKKSIDATILSPLMKDMVSKVKPVWSNELTRKDK